VLLTSVVVVATAAAVVVLPPPPASLILVRARSVVLSGSVELLPERVRVKSVPGLRASVLNRGRRRRPASGPPKCSVSVVDAADVVSSTARGRIW
jgi:hypothetical protein